MKFDNDEIKKIAHLARININENEAKKVSEKLEGILLKHHFLFNLC